MMTLLGKLLVSHFIDHPVFVVGLGRSGTTVLLQAVGKHPCIFSIKGESPLVYHLGALTAHFDRTEYNDWHYRSLKFSREYLIESIRRLSFESVFGTNWGLEEILKRQIRGHIFLPKLRYWSARTYPQEHESQGILTYFPNAKFLYIFRNGIDVVQSRTRYRAFRDLSFSDHCEEWARHVDKYTYMLKMKEALPIRQEDLRVDPQKVFEQICPFIGAPYHSGPVDYLKSTLVHPLDQSTKRGIDVHQALNSRPPSHESWSTEKKDTFKNVCGNAMTKLGYQIPF
jgi:sulfotransferase family protein